MGLDGPVDLFLEVPRFKARQVHLPEMDHKVPASFHLIHHPHIFFSITAIQIHDPGKPVTPDLLNRLLRPVKPKVIRCVFHDP